MQSGPAPAQHGCSDRACRFVIGDANEPAERVFSMAISGTIETPIPVPTIPRMLLACPFSKMTCGSNRAR
jgi:hypothetical protein